MNKIMARMTPDAITQIRMDHTHAIATFHRYRLDAPDSRKRMLADALGLALEIHAKLEEEIFYPAMRRIDPDLVDKSIPEHNEMRRLIARLHEMHPSDPGFDNTVMELMRDVMRHVAEEETMMLPDAERVLGERVDELGAEMTRRRLELAAPKTGTMALDLVRTFPGIIAVSGVALIGAFMIGRGTRPASPTRRLMSSMRELPRLASSANLGKVTRMARRSRLPKLLQHAA
jgi:hypothetical protein